ncbi:MAG: tetraacyldisaccharide 4-kinase [Panacagrimonas sp.]|nr:tetraacyldisaccharide 4'-kinase [Panacagrimonas sp.]MCC2655581.1 tetraacyldisaccharide 4-kinase [Panacagrimonas sp.]
MRAWLEHRWYSEKRPPPSWLLPLSSLFGVVARVRRRRIQPQSAPLPVIVVGNLAVGGTGKTPFVIWLVEQLREWGLRPGVISRGYGGRAPRYPWRVTGRTPVSESGDEPLLIALRTAAPVMVGADRVAAARALAAQAEIDVLISDDGLQHYRLARALEICVIDGRRGLGNGALLPAGPLREPASRLDEVGLVVINGEGYDTGHPGQLTMELRAVEAESLAGGAALHIDRLRGQRVHAIAGIGNPSRFFDMLRGRGVEVIEHPFPDHHAYTGQDIQFLDGLMVLMTEKDAVKCRDFAGPLHYAVPVRAHVDDAGTARVRALVQQSCAPPADAGSR